MEEMDDVCAKLQIYLMKKDNDCGKLRFLTSRTTTENNNDVQEICDKIGDILRSFSIPTDEDTSTSDPRCVRAYNFLALNTNFVSQESLTEDPLNGHLVDICPPLSPYLLAEILWSLRYEEIVAESILHVPLDLAVELIEISRRCINLLDFPRGLNFLSLMTLNCYKILRLIDANGALTTRPDESLERLMIYCQELMALFLDPKFTRINDVASLQKSERHGLILKRMLGLTRDSLYCSKNGVPTSSSEIAKIYKITLGRQTHRRMNENFVTQLGMLDQEFVHVLLKKLTEIAVSTYIDWASLEDSGNSGISLQKSIGMDCYDFMEFARKHENLMQLDKLIECLQQISTKPVKFEAKYDELDLDELRKGTIDGRNDCLKEIMRRYREWNHEIFHFVRKNRASLDKDDFFNLLEYLTYVITKDGQEEHKREVYATVTKVLLQQDIKAVYETIIDYIMKHEARNTLESSNTEDVFKKFMLHNKNFKSSTNLRLVLFFLVKNPRKILSILVKMSIGHPDYENVMITPSDLVLLSPVMNIREKENETLLISTLRQVCGERIEWSSKKFSQLVRVMLDECVIRSDDIVNNVFIPCLNESTGHLANVRSILNCIREIIESCTKETNFDSLVITIAKRMSKIRDDIGIRKYSMSQAIGLMTRIIGILSPKLENWLDLRGRREFIENLERSLGPIDKHHFARLLLSDPSGKIDIYDTVRDYERRCFVSLARIRDKISNDEKRKHFDIDTGSLEEHYIRHIIVLSTESEYVKFAIEMTIFQWDMFNCKNEYLAYDKIVRLTIEACVLCLEFPDSNSPDSIASLLKGLARFTRTLMTIERVRDYEKIDKSLISNLRNLDNTIERTIFSSLYKSFLVEINNRDTRESVDEKLHDLVRSIDNFGDKCLDVSQDEIFFEGEPSNDAKRYKIAHDFVTEITSHDYVDDNNSAICSIYKFLCIPEIND